MFLFLDDHRVVTNATQKKYDVYREDSFVMEIKVLGGNYQNKVIGSLAQDFEKLKQYTGTEQKYVLLVLDNRCQSTTLYDALFNYQNELGKLVFYQDYGPFCILLWRVL